MTRVLLAMDEYAYTRLFDAESLARLERLAELTSPSWVSTFDDSSALTEADILITGWSAPVLDAQQLDKAPRLRAVLHAAGSVRHYIAPECWKRGIVISSAADANAIPVAEFTLASILYAGKRVHQFVAATQANRGARSLSFRDTVADASNYRKVVGLVGLSRVGARVASLLRPFDLTVLAADPYATRERTEALGATLVDLDELIERSDVVSLHAPLLPSTEHMLDAARLARMRDGATLINTARGALVDTAALTTELVSGRLCAILDVTEPEPLPADSPLFDLPNVQLTPHIAGALNTEIRRLGDLALDELERYLTGQPLLHRIHAEELERLA